MLASFASLGDVILAEPGALIGFAGARVASGTVGEELPEGFQSAERSSNTGSWMPSCRAASCGSTVARLLRLLPVAGLAAGRKREARDSPHRRPPGPGQRVGGAVSETAGIDTETPAR